MLWRVIATYDHRRWGSTDKDAVQVSWPDVLDRPDIARSKQQHKLRGVSWIDSAVTLMIDDNYISEIASLVAALCIVADRFQRGKSDSGCPRIPTSSREGHYSCTWRSVPSHCER